MEIKDEVQIVDKDKVSKDKVSKDKVSKDKVSDSYDKEYCHKVDKKCIPTCSILGVDIAAINMNWLLKFTDRYIRELSGDYMCVANVHTTVSAYEDCGYCSIQNGGIMALPDGGPLSAVGRKRGYKSMRRTTGPGYMEEIFNISAQKGYRHYFLGSTEETLEKLYKRLNEEYPALQIAGMYSPPFRPMTWEENEALVRLINETKPDFLWIGMGAPKQERWMAQHQGRINGFMVGVGAGFDYFAGNIYRAPQWMQNCSLEWLFRLIQEPKRLFKRYWYSNWKFIWYVVVKGR